MEIVVKDKEIIKELLRYLKTLNNIVVNISYQEIGNIQNSTLTNVNTCNHDKRI